LLYETALECGINRVSIGVQSFNDDELRQSGRVHNSNQAAIALRMARKAGITDISADIIIGLPGQGWQSLKGTVDSLLENEVTHLSAYCLSIEDGSQFAENPPENLPGDDEQVELYEKARVYLKRCGFIHYEISNFCKPGMQCQHNLNYWRGGEYIGLGPAAASHLSGYRFKNAEDLEYYLNNPQRTRIESEVLDLPTKLGEEAMLRLRLLEEGLNLGEIEDRFGRLSVGLAQKLEVLASNKYLVKHGSCFRIPASKVLTSNSILAEVLN
jgi:oxygen-independent coproporphyrinogen-3 oxidase